MFIFLFTELQSSCKMGNKILFTGKLSLSPQYFPEFLIRKGKAYPCHFSARDFHLKKYATNYHGTCLGNLNQTNFSSTKRCFCKTKTIQEKVLIFFPGNIHITTRKLSYFLLCLVKLNQKYSDGQNDPEGFHISSAFPMAGLVLL